jgi:predicted Zn-dependent peptidase
MTAPRACALILLCCIAPPVWSAYLPDSLFEPLYARLDNGMEVYLIPRNGVHSVSMRLAVGYGTLDEPCGRRELPHFLEHMLFTGTGAHSEEELDALISDNGGTWNAYTYDDSTVYEVDIFNANARTGLEVLHEIVASPSLAAEKAELTRDIIARENGGRPSALTSWLLRRGIGMDAWDQAQELLVNALYCREFSSAESIALDDVRSAYARWYVPGNMALFVAGDFTPAEMRAWIAGTFGGLPRAAAPAADRPDVAGLDARREVAGTLAPLLGTEAKVALAFRMPGTQERTGAFDTLLYEQLAEVLYNEIRTRRGLAYSADVEHYTNRDYGLLYAYADTELSTVDEVVAIMEEELARLRTDGVDAGRLETLKRRSLMKVAQYFQSNASFADYLATNWGSMVRNGEVWNVERAVAGVTAEGFGDYIRRHLDPERMVVVRHTPVLTYNQFYTIVLALVLVLAAAGGVWIWRRGGVRRRSE